MNFFAGNPLNRLSWLRSSHDILNALVTSDQETRWILFNNGQPLITSRKTKQLAFLTTEQVKPLLGSEPYFGQSEVEGRLITLEEAKIPTLESARHFSSPVVFLGLEEPRGSGTRSALPSSDFKDPINAVQNLKGTPYFALDVGDLDANVVLSVLKASKPAGAEEELQWIEPRSVLQSLDTATAGIFAEARSMVDWNSRNKFCPGCGSAIYSLWGGWKLGCRSLLSWAKNEGRKTCPTVKGLHNFTYPRTDSVVIMVTIDQSGNRILLGNSKKFPGKFYSALAGFIEPGETFEEAVKRELWEEAGVEVWDVQYHSGQPWPYPANLMVGFYATADSSKPVRTDLDNELLDARWFTRSEIQAVLANPLGTNMSGGTARFNALEQRLNNAPKVDASAAAALAHSDPRIDVGEKKVEQGGRDEPPFRVPPVTAIAGLLIKDWADGKIKNTILRKGNL